MGKTKIDFSSPASMKSGLMEALNSSAGGGLENVGVLLKLDNSRYIDFEDDIVRIFSQASDGTRKWLADVLRAHADQEGFPDKLKALLS